MASSSRIQTTLDFERPGKQQGWLRTPYSSHASAYGWIPIPLIVINNGDGPRVLLMAGNHGDEYEGQIALLKLSKTLSASAVRGRLIILPAANFAAANAGMRTSPLDAGNLNRSFPGDADGGPTAMIAHFIEAQLLPLVDYVVDLHSGGSSLLYIANTFISHGHDDQLDAKAMRMLRAFAAPIACIGELPGEDRTMDAAARRAGVAYLGTELGGGGSPTPGTLRIAEQGLRRLLARLASVPGLRTEEPVHATRLMQVGAADYFVYSPEYGLWEPLVELGDEVQPGQAAAAVHFPNTPWRAPEPVAFARAGKVICKRVPGRVERGDCLFHLATDIVG